MKEQSLKDIKKYIDARTQQGRIVETTLVVSRFHFLRVGSRISKLRVIILPGTKILKAGSLLSLQQGHNKWPLQGFKFQILHYVFCDF